MAIPDGKKQKSDHEQTVWLLVDVKYTDEAVIEDLKTKLRECVFKCLGYDYIPTIETTETKKVRLFVQER